MGFRAPQIAFGFLNLVERAAALAQGKGYGTATMVQEVQHVHSVLGAPPRLVIDVGGNVGDYTAEIRRRNARTEIHIFEPSASNIAKLTSRFHDDSLVTVVPVAISNVTGSATLFSNAPGSGLGSLTQRRLDHFRIPFDTQETVETIRFEDYWRAALGSRQLDIVKIDIEGHEFAGLKGFGGALSATRVLQFEFGGCNIDTRTYFQDFWYYFKDNKFDIFRITPLGAEKLSRYKESDECFRTTNFIAVNQSQA